MKSEYRAKLLGEVAELKGKSGASGNSGRPRKEPSFKDRRQPKILIVDDDPGMACCATGFLEDNGFTTISVLSVAQAREKLQSGLDFSLILCDLKMPEEDGFVLLNFLRKNLRFAHIPVIMVTALADDEVVVKCLRLGAKDYLAKPFGREALVSKVTKVLESRYGTVQIVSEDAIVTRLISDTLQKRGYHVVVSQCGEEALKTQREQQLVAIISDLVHCDMTGFDFLIKSHETLDMPVPIVFISDPQVPISERRVIEMGGHGIIPRPFNRDDILQKVDSVRLQR